MEQVNGKYVFKNVMVIDDSEIDRYVATYNIKEHHFAEETIAMESAKAALEYLRSCENKPENLPQFIFLDIRMPEIDGFGFLDEYSKLTDMIQKKCIVMMLSSSLNPDDHERAEKNKFVSRFLNKPLDKEKLNMLKAFSEQESLSKL
jgi:CheY-like chemotaxis protein